MATPIMVGAASGVGGCFAGFLVGKSAGARSIRIEDIDDKKQMVGFLKKMCASRKSPEYAEFYRFLLNVFQRADRDFDGLVRTEDFDLMVEMAGCIPRKFAFAPTSAEQFASDGERLAYRKAKFAAIDADGSGTITFDEWLNYSYQHVCEMTATIDENKVDLGLTSKERFKEWCVNACRSRRSSEYKELYDLLLSEFVKADKDKIGKVDLLGFDKLIDLAAAWPRKFGYAPDAATMYKTDNERIAARKVMFEQMDTDGNGTITFDECLDFIYKHICEKTQQFDSSLTGQAPAFTPGKAGACPYGFGK